jgi:hypothetical protein
MNTELVTSQVPSSVPEGLDLSALADELVAGPRAVGSS